MEKLAHDVKQQGSRQEAYEKPSVTFVKLQPEERLMACTKLKDVCDPGFDKNS